MELSSDLACAYVAILTMALLPIYLGSHLSLSQKSVTQILDDDKDDSTDNHLKNNKNQRFIRKKKQTETLTWESAWAFPFIGSGVLFGLYILFKIFSKEYINLLMTLYFAFFGIGALTVTISQMFDYIITSPKKNKIVVTIYNFWEEAPTPQSFNLNEVISFLFAICLGVWYFWTKHWIVNNLFGLAFCIQAISLFSMGSFRIGCLLLIGLFFYDIFWVFGTDVMVTVAKSFDAPVKLLFPKNIFAETQQFSMLGLGDIVIPGFFLALLLRFDQKNSDLKNKEQFNEKPYFHTTFVAYILGLATTIFVMHSFQAAQPALLYLVPFCILGSISTAIVRKEFRSLWLYSEEQEQEQETTNPSDNDSNGKELPSSSSSSSSSDQSVDKTTASNATDENKNLNLASNSSKDSQEQNKKTL